MASKEVASKFVKIRTVNGKHLLAMPTGDIIPGVVFTRVYDDTTCATYVIAKIVVSLVDDKDTCQNQ